MSPTGGEAEDQTNGEGDEAVAEEERRAETETAAHGDVPLLPPRPTRPLPRRVPSQNPNRTAPDVTPPTDRTVRHLLDILKRLP